jgi:hypothetical protein
VCEMNPHSERVMATMAARRDVDGMIMVSP